MAEHTPGPWRIGNGTKEESDDDIIAACGTHVVCFGHDYDDYGGIGARSPSDWNESGRAHFHDECAANARLIAAAPELFEALKNCAGWIDPDEHGLVNYEEAEALLAKVEALIAKVEGRSEKEVTR